MNDTEKKRSESTSQDDLPSLPVVIGAPVGFPTDRLREMLAAALKMANRFRGSVTEVIR